MQQVLRVYSSHDWYAQQAIWHAEAVRGMQDVWITSGHEAMPCCLQCDGIVSCGAFMVDGGQMMMSYRSAAGLHVPFWSIRPWLRSKFHILAYESGGIHVE